MVSLAVMRKNYAMLLEENEALEKQIENRKERSEHWKMLSELFLEEINKAKIRYGCVQVDEE